MDEKKKRANLDLNELKRPDGFTHSGKAAG